ncbi:proton pump-interactor 1-like protein [Tanacetum coccineum]
MGDIDGIESELAHVAVENGKKETSVNWYVGEIDSGESVRVEKSPDTSFPTDVVDEWPEKKKFHQRAQSGSGPITEKLRPKRTEQAQVISQLKELVEEKNRCMTIMDGKRKDIEPLQQALGKLQGPKNDSRDNRNYICSSEEELKRMHIKCVLCVASPTSTTCFGSAWFCMVLHLISSVLSASAWKSECVLCTICLHLIVDIHGQCQRSTLNNQCPKVQAEFVKGA